MPTRFSLAAFAVLAFLLAACGSTAAPLASQSASAAPASAPATTKPSAAAPSSSSSAAPAASGLKKVRYGELQILGDAGVYVALEQGFFAQQGIDLELVKFDTAVNMVPALGTGQLDAGGGATSAGLLNAISRGVALQAVADKGHLDATPPGFPVADLLVRKDLWDSGKVKSVADLKGLTLSQPAKGFSGDITSAKELAKGGLKPSDVNYVQIPISDVAAAYANKKVDAGGATEPSRTVIVDIQHTGVTLMHDYDADPSAQTAVILFGPDFAKSPQAVPFITAYLQGVRVYNDGFVKKDPAARAKAIDALTKHTVVKDRSLFDKMTVQGLDSNGAINLQSMEEQQDYWLSHGDQQTKVDLSKVVNDSLAKQAVAKLGPYTR